MRPPRIINTGIFGIREEMSRMGVDPTGIGIMEGKSRHLLIRLDEVDLRAALILKQNLLSLGGEAALRKEAAGLTVQATPALLMGTVLQLRRLVDKLKSQPFGLSDLAQSLTELLHRIDERATFIVGGRDLLEDPKVAVMGVLNVTPDSFSDGGKFLDLNQAVSRGVEMNALGASIIDVGGESTRPGSRSVEAEEEIRRVIPVIEGLFREGVGEISVDTTRASVAQKALDAGATIINDISAMTFDPGMPAIASSANASVILMHTRGRPETMQNVLEYKDLLGEIALYLGSSVERVLEAGIPLERICVDPGIGFGKSPEQNLEIIGRIGELRSVGTAVMVGASRKSFIGAVSGADVDERIPGSLAAVTAAVLRGADMVRVHDVSETVQALAVATGIREHVQC
ncbi:MAG: dihydropteroate synthase [bacterium]|nr:dihydropteroate synthase [bacterium]MDT8396113.1 dihydropteroate synthase [bacterium]